jgi:hypothetical protein
MVHLGGENGLAFHLAGLDFMVAQGLKAGGMRTGVERHDALVRIDAGLLQREGREEVAGGRGRVGIAEGVAGHLFQAGDAGAGQVVMEAV